MRNTDACTTSVRAVERKSPGSVEPEAEVYLASEPPLATGG
jgi:hypothetical protein